MPYIHDSNGDKSLPYIHDSSGESGLPYIHDATGRMNVPDVHEFREDLKNNVKIVAIESQNKPMEMTLKDCIEITKAAEVTLIKPEILDQCQDTLNDVDQLEARDCLHINKTGQLVHLSLEAADHCRRLLRQGWRVHIYLVHIF